jgi:hypothetical protein
MDLRAVLNRSGKVALLLPAVAAGVAAAKATADGVTSTPTLTGASDSAPQSLADSIDFAALTAGLNASGGKVSSVAAPADYFVNNGPPDASDPVPQVVTNHHTIAAAAVPAATTVGVAGDGKPDFQYDPATGHLFFRTDGGTFTTTGGASSFVSSLTISSAGGNLIPTGASNVFSNGTGATLTANLLSSALTNTPGFTDNFDIGAVLAPGLTADQLTADLTVKFQSLNGGALKLSDIIVPEPTSLALLSLGAGGLLARRRSRKRDGAAES